MARETKEDRIVRNIFAQSIEHLHELKNLELNSNSKESDVEVWAQSFLKNCLGFTPSLGYSIRSQESKGRMRPDLIILQNEKPIFVVEIKKLGFDLNKSNFRSGKTQLGEYLNTLGGVSWGILTNGTEWRLFDFSNQEYSGIEISAFDLKSENDQIETNKKIVEEICYELLDFHETSYRETYWKNLSKEAMAFSPESLSKAILSNDIIKCIAKFVRGQHEYKANQEILTDKVYWLLEQGLNDAVAGWNETKAAELHKYVKSQKRACRKNKRNDNAKKVIDSEVPELKSDQELDPVVTIDKIVSEKTAV